MGQFRPGLLHDTTQERWERGRLSKSSQMLQWAMAGEGARFALFVHHQREYSYDRADRLQQFDKGWDEAIAQGWTVVSMKDDWNTVFPTADR